MHSPERQVAKLHWIKLRMWHKAVMKDPDLSDRAARLIGILWHYINGQMGVAWPSIEVLARDMGKSPSTVKRALAELRARGYLTVKRRRDGSNIYRVPERFASEAAAQLAGQLKSAPSDGANLTPNTAEGYTLEALPIYDTPCGASAEKLDLDEIGERALDQLIKATREAAGVRAPFSVYWSDKALCGTVADWLDLGLSPEQIVGTIREMRRDRPGVPLNSPAYFTDRMADIAAGNRGAYVSAVTATDHLAAVVGREMAEEFVACCEDDGKLLSPLDGRMIADQLRAYDDPEAAISGCLAHGSSVPFENGSFRARPR